MRGLRFQVCLLTRALPYRRSALCLPGPHAISGDVDTERHRMRRRRKHLGGDRGNGVSVPGGCPCV